MKPENNFSQIFISARLAAFLCSSLLVSCGELLTTAGIGGQPVDASIAKLSPPNIVLDNSVEVEVKGSIVGGVLFADEVKLR